MSRAAPAPRSTPPPITLVENGGWRARAACDNHPALPPSAWDDMHIGVQETAPARDARIAAAKKVCRTECLADVDLDYDEGVRGGQDIRDLRVARRRIAAGRLRPASGTAE